MNAAGNGIPNPHRGVLADAIKRSKEAPEGEISPEEIDALPCPYTPAPPLPTALDRYADEAAAAIFPNFPRDMVKVPMLGVLAAAIGTTRVLTLKKGATGWREFPVCWPVIVAESGSAKSAALTYAIAPMKRERARLHDEHQREMATWKKEAAAAAKAGDEKPEPPRLERISLGDTTCEKLVTELAHAPRGLLVYRDELSGFFGGLGRYSAGGAKADADTAVYLECSRGGAIEYDRKTAGEHFYIRRALVSICGGIQPAKLRRAMTPSLRESGFFARLVFCRPPRACAQFNQRFVPQSVEDEYFGIYGRLRALTHDPDGEPREMYLSAEARDEFQRFYDEAAGRAFVAEGDTAAAHAKAPGVAASLAILFALAQAAGEPEVNLDALTDIDARSMRLAILWAEWSAEQAERIFSTADADPALSPASHQVIQWLRDRGGERPLRDLYRNGVGGLATRDGAMEMARRLQAAGLVQIVYPNPSEAGPNAREVVRVIPAGLPDIQAHPTYPTDDICPIPGSPEAQTSGVGSVGCPKRRVEANGVAAPITPARGVDAAIAQALLEAERRFEELREHGLDVAEAREAAMAHFDGQAAGLSHPSIAAAADRLGALE